MPLSHIKVRKRRPNGKVRGRSNRHLDQLTFLSSFWDAGQFMLTDIPENTERDWKLEKGHREFCWYLDYQVASVHSL